jgi:hypothetical protein
MKANYQQVDSCGVPMWISKFCNQHQTICLSDTRTYRLLMVIYRSIIEMSMPPTVLETDHEKELEGIITWFIQQGSSMPAWLGLMWIYQGIGQKIVAADCEGKISKDERLSRLLMAFIVLSEGNANDPLVEHYYEMVREGWERCPDEDYKESLYRGFIATFVTHANRELVAFGEAHDFPEAKTKEALRSAAAYFAAGDQ